ncbi:MAG: 30S ribosomal protein S2 [Nanoarchaeota archaeon]|nr:30S ribosomal protein S2 [Nanoarchaeota archaeon]
MLTEKTDYLTAGIHIGMKTCNQYMKEYVYKVREDGLAVFNLQKVDERLTIAASFLASFEKILVVSRKDTAAKSITTFAKATKSTAISGRFNPGTLTNPAYRDFTEPDVVFVVDPLIDEQVIVEAKQKRIPIVALCGTFNSAKNVDLVLPVNNNGKKSLALIFFLLAREIHKHRGNKEDFSYELKDFLDEREPKSQPGRHRDKRRGDYANRKPPARRR